MQSFVHFKCNFTEKIPSAGTTDSPNVDDTLWEPFDPRQDHCSTKKDAKNSKPHIRNYETNLLTVSLYCYPFWVQLIEKLGERLK